MSTLVEIRKLTTPQELFDAAAEVVIRCAQDATEKRKRFTIALSGGSTPKGLFNLLANNAKNVLPWDQTYFFWGDERHVPPTDSESNFRMADETMLSKIPVAAANVFRIKAENLILLGMGPDVHTASLFPGTDALKEKSRLVVANWVEKFKTHRITFTLPVLNAARNVAFLVSGTDKADALKEILESDAPGEKYPAKLVKPADGKLLWLVDRAAASKLKEE